MWVYSLVLLNLLLLGWYTRLFLGYRKAWVSIPEDTDRTNTEGPVSIVVAVRNEERSLPGLFESLDRQEGSDRLEFIFIDDHSTDNSPAMLQHWVSLRSNAKCTVLGEGKKGKKAAIEEGILAAEADHILCTDADTQPGPLWAKSMLECARKEKAVFVSGPVTMIPDVTWFSRWQALEFTGLIAIGAAAIRQNRPNMCNGANLLFRKEAFFEVGGYEGNESIASGDDQFLMHKLFDRYPEGIAFCKNKEAAVATRPMATLKAFVHQRIRWASKGGQFAKQDVNTEMMATWFLCFLLLAESVLAFFQPVLFVLVLFSFSVKLALEYHFYRSVLPFFERKGLLRRFWFSEIVHVIYVFAIGTMAKFVSFEWKGRKYP